MMVWGALLVLGVVDIAALIAIVSPATSIRITYPLESPIREKLEAQLATGSNFWKWRLGFLLVILISLRGLIPIVRSLLSHHN